MSQISRILAGKIKRTSPNVTEICKCAKITSPQQKDSSSEKLLMRAVKEIWDGTNEHGIALASLLSAIDRYQEAIQKPTEMMA